MNQADWTVKLQLQSKRIDSVAFPLKTKCNEKKKLNWKIIDRSKIDAPIPVIIVERQVDKLRNA